ncbi:MAG: metallophosphoesterase family protein [Butyrivibrio sp.]|nr:metallophosphoesterase family protein [Butyrivibrio sp.]
MNIAVLSDIHGNHVALKTCLDYLKDKEIDTYCFLGDYTGEFPGIEQSMQMLYELKENNNCVFIRGNKENYLLSDLGKEYPEWDEYPSTVGIMRYANKHLTNKDLEFFNSLPITTTLKNEGMPDIIICHGSPRKVSEKFARDEKALKEVVEAAEAKYIVCGHTHRIMEKKYEDTYIWNPGAVGASVELPYSYRFMIIHSDNGEWKPEFVSLDPDVDKILTEMKESELYEIAPYWTKFTELMVMGACGKYTHGGFLTRAMDICFEKNGECNWPKIPEECYAEALSDMP